MNAPPEAIASSSPPRGPGRTYQDLLATDTLPHAVPTTFRTLSWAPLGDDDVPVERYTSREFHDLERERMWSRVWQMACREEHIPEPGDTYVYDICDQSVLVVRVSTTEIKAYVNACLHRGRQLREEPGPATELRCAFHGFCWNLDGSLRQVPCAWDFPAIVPADWQLPEVRVGTWGGFVFVNLDPGCAPLADHVAGLDEQFAKWPLDRRYVSVHVEKVFHANWKVVQEAFMEAFHVVATHPQLLAGLGDAITQYDWSGNWSRAITPNGTPSPHIGYEPSEQDMFDAVSDRRLDEPPFVELREGMTARGVAGAGSRARLRPVLGAAADELSDAELADSIYFTLFPNFHPWGAYNRIVYRFRPDGDAHDRSLMECMYLDPWPEGEPRPAPAPVHRLGADDDWTDAPQLGMLARVFNQDSFNLPKVQRGLRTTRKPGVTLARYQETKIRHFHHLLGQWVAD